MERITEDDVRERLSRHYGGDNSTRELVKNKRADDHGTLGSIVYSLSGSPPKGYAIAIPDIRLVNFYGNRGERFAKLTETVVVSSSDADGETCPNCHGAVSYEGIYPGLAKCVECGYVI